MGIIINQYMDPYKTNPRWWQFQIFFIFIPKIGEMIPILTSIFFRWVGEKTPAKKQVGSRVFSFKFHVSYTLPETNRSFAPGDGWNSIFVVFWGV